MEATKLSAKYFCAVFKGPLGKNQNPQCCPHFSAVTATNTDGRTVQEAVGSDDGPPTSRVILRMSLPLGVSIDLATKRG